MKDLLNLILQNITTHPDEVKIEESEDEGRIAYTITVHPEDMGRVIGKSGKVIKAIRSLAHVIAIRQNQRFRINVAEVGEGTPETAKPEDVDATQQTTDDSVPADDSELLSGAIDIAEETATQPAAETQSVTEIAAEQEATDQKEEKAE